MKKLLIVAVLFAAFIIGCDCPEQCKQEKPVLSVLDFSFSYVTVGIVDSIYYDVGVLMRDNTVVDTVLYPTWELYDTTVEPGTEYKYVVVVWGECGMAISDTLTVTTEAQPLPPTNISGFNYNPDFLFIEFSWNDVQRENKYVMYRNGVALSELPANSTSFIDSTVSENTSYLYSFYAENEIGFSNVITQQVKTRGAFVATWDANSESDLAGYKLWLLLGKGEFLIYDGTDISHNFVVNELPCCQLAAYDRSGNISERTEIVCTEEQL